MSLLSNLTGRFQRAGTQLLLGGHVRVSPIDPNDRSVIAWVELDAPAHQGQPENVVGDLGASLWVHAYAEAAYGLDRDLRARLGDQLEAWLSAEVELAERMEIGTNFGPDGPAVIRLSPALPRTRNLRLQIGLRHTADARATLVGYDLRGLNHPGQLAAALLLLAGWVVDRASEARRPNVRDTLRAFVDEFMPAAPPRRSRVDGFLREHAPKATPLRPFRRRARPQTEMAAPEDLRFRPPERRED
jgi:hypothetical protein